MQDWFSIINDTIDMRSFSTLWFWIVIAVLWSMQSHFVLGIPYDLVVRARRQGGEVEADLEQLARINAERLLYYIDRGLPVAVGAVAFILTSLATLAFGYDYEFPLALLFIAAPMVPVGALSVRTARRIRAGEGQGAALYRRLWRHRVSVQAVGVVSLCLTAGFGMGYNLVNAHMLVR